MSIQRSLKKGFTLIELMVVIVIIGILAAVAIPKLFGMSAKAKAQEAGPAAGTWVKMQMAYQMETSSWGSPDEISYILPGDKDGLTSNFKYAAAGSNANATWSAVSQFDSDPCKKGATWAAELGSYGSVAEMKITGANSDDDGCLSLTPNYFSIGCAVDPKTSKAPKCEK